MRGWTMRARCVARALAVRSYAAVFVIAVLSSACDATPSSEASALPCDVQALLQTSCQSCHAAQPKFGAPMPLVTRADLMATRPSGERVLDAVLRRTHDEAKPMPPTGLLAASELEVLSQYAEADAPESSAACEQDVGSGPSEEGPDDLPCEITDRFVAFGDNADSPFAVGAAAGNLIQCFAFASPWTDGQHGTAFAPIIDDDRVLHHWILWSSEQAIAPGTSWNCAQGMPSDARFVTGWAPGGGNRVMPEGVGMELPGPGSVAILQVHYWNVAGYDDVRDRSGVALCASNEPVDNLLTVSTLGTLNIAIPPRSNGYSTSGLCKPAITEPVQILSSGPHMHNLGRTFVTEILRGGDENQVEVLAAVDPWDFNSQGQVPSEATIFPGDVLRTTCTFDNPLDRVVTFGERTEDEMCFNFVAAYPAGALVNEPGRSRRFCMGD